MAQWQERLLGPEGPDWNPLERALVEALVDRHGMALDFYTLCDVLWTARGLDVPDSVESSLRNCVTDVRRKLAEHHFNPTALVGVPPRSYGLNLAVLDTPVVRRPCYILRVASQPVN